MNSFGHTSHINYCAIIYDLFIYLRSFTIIYDLQLRSFYKSEIGMLKLGKAKYDFETHCETDGNPTKVGKVPFQELSNNSVSLK